MEYRLLAETLVHLKPTQVVHQLLHRVTRPTLRAVEAPVVSPLEGLVPPIGKSVCCVGEAFTFLNIQDTFRSWQQTEHGMLWAYNLNYMDWLGQEGLSPDLCEHWIDTFMAGLPQNQVGQDPYPTALRSINWIKFFCQHPDKVTEERLDSLYAQVLLLERTLEYRLLGNHLLEDAYALFIASVYFHDQRLYRKASKLLLGQLKEQVLADGAHYEQSPMYHCIMLDRLLDCVNFSRTTDDADLTARLVDYAVRMLGHLECVVWRDGSIPLLNDAAYGIAPTADQLFGYARRLGLSWAAVPMKACGYRKLESKRLEAIVDVGNITATYQPGHTHADTLHYELRIDGRPFIVDTGISTYDKTPRRQYERGTSAHNCVVVGGRDSSRVWGGFRVGRRARVTLLQDDGTTVCASHDGYGKPCRRRFRLDDDAFSVEDCYEGEAVSYIHLAEGATADRIIVEGAENIEVKEHQYSTEYNTFRSGKVMAITFRGTMKYTIR